MGEFVWIHNSQTHIYGQVRQGPLEAQHDLRNWPADNIKGEDANRCVAQEVKLPSLIYTRLDLRHLAETHKLPGHCYHLRGLHCTWSD